MKVRPTIKCPRVKTTIMALLNAFPLLMAGSFGCSGQAFAATLICSQPGSKSDVGDSIFEGYDVYANTNDLTARIVTRYRNKNDETKRSELTELYKNGASGNVVVSYTNDGRPITSSPEDIKNNQIVTIRKDFFGWGDNGQYGVTFDKIYLQMFCRWGE